MSTHKQPTARLSELTAALPGLIESLELDRLELDQQMAVLKEQGLIYANPHWREQKYLTLLYPMKPGEDRRREYVGKDPQKVRTRSRRSSGRRTTSRWQRAPKASRKRRRPAAPDCRMRFAP